MSKEAHKLFLNVTFCKLRNIAELGDYIPLEKNKVWGAIYLERESTL